MSNHNSNQEQHQRTSTSTTWDEARDETATLQPAMPAPSNPMLAELNIHRLSFDEYFRRVQQTVDQVQRHWKEEQRVKTLKLVIQLAKLLADTRQLRLYSRKYKLITDCLDQFGRLIYERVHGIAEKKCEQDYGDDDGDGRDKEAQLELARDICRNWFLKVASIRELVPRFYCELAILRAGDILLPTTAIVGHISKETRKQEQLRQPKTQWQQQTFDSAQTRQPCRDAELRRLFARTLRRLIKCAWGLGNPVVALHARAYLSRVAERLCGGGGGGGGVPWPPANVHLAHSQNDNGPGSGGPPSGNDNDEDDDDSLLFELQLANLADCVRLVRLIDVERQLEQSNFDGSGGGGGDGEQQSASNFATTLFDLICAPLQSMLGQLARQLDADAETPTASPQVSARQQTMSDDSERRRRHRCLDEAKRLAKSKLERVFATMMEAAKMSAAQRAHDEAPVTVGHAAAAQRQASALACHETRHDAGGAEQERRGADKPLSARQKDDDIFAQCILVNAISRALPSDLVAERAAELLAALELSHRALVASLAARNNARACRPLALLSPSRQSDNDDGAGRQHDGPNNAQVGHGDRTNAAQDFKVVRNEAGGVQQPVQVHWRQQLLLRSKQLTGCLLNALTSFLVALDSSDTFEAELAESEQARRTRGLATLNACAQISESLLSLSSSFNKVQNDDDDDELKVHTHQCDQTDLRASEVSGACSCNRSARKLSLALDASYLRCFKACVSFSAHYLSTAPESGPLELTDDAKQTPSCDSHEIGRVTERLLASFVTKIQSKRVYAEHYADILDLIKIIFSDRTGTQEASKMFTWKPLRQLLEFLRRDEHKLEAARWILETMRASAKLARRARPGLQPATQQQQQRNQQGDAEKLATPSELASAQANERKSAKLNEKGMSKRATIDFLLRLFRMLNDSLNPLTAADDREHLAQLVIFHLKNIHIESPQEQLEFCVNCRSRMGNFDSVLEYLTRRVLLELPVSHRRLEKRRSARQTFLNACLAFAFVTIPSVSICSGVGGYDYVDDDEDGNQPNPSHGHASATTPQSALTTGGAPPVAGGALCQFNLYAIGARLALDSMSLSLGDSYLRQCLATLAEALDHFEQSSELQWRQQQQRQQQEAERPRAAPRSSLSTIDSKGALERTLMQQLDTLLNLVARHQDNVDLKHKLGLATLVKRWTRIMSQRLNSAEDEQHEQANDGEEFLQRLLKINGCHLANDEDD